MLQSYFRSGWAFLIPYLAAYLLYAWLKWPVNPVAAGSGTVGGGQLAVSAIGALPPTVTPSTGTLSTAHSLLSTGVPCLLHVYWFLHALHLVLGALALRAWWRESGTAVAGATDVSESVSNRAASSQPSTVHRSPSTVDRLPSTVYRLLPWLLLALLFYIPGVYLEWPSDPNAHLGRILGWFQAAQVTENGQWLKSAYFLAFSFASLGSQTAPEPLLNLYYTAVCLLLTWQHFRLALEMKLGARAAIFFAALQLIVYGNSEFSYHRYYGLSSTIVSQIASVAILRIVLHQLNKTRWTTAISRALPALLTLLVIVVFNHIQGLLITAVGLASLALWLLSRHHRTALITLGLGAFLGSLVFLARGNITPSKSLTILQEAGWLNVAGGFNLFEASSPARHRFLELIGTFGLGSSLLALFMFRGNHPGAWLMIAPLAFLIVPVTAYPLALYLMGDGPSFMSSFHGIGLDQMSVYSRLLFAMPLALPVAWLYSESLQHPRLHRHAPLVPLVTIWMLVALPPSGYNHARFWQALSRTPSDLELRPVRQTFGLIRALTESGDEKKIIGGSGISNLIGTMGAKAVPYSRRLILYPKTVAPTEDLQLIEAYFNNYSSIREFLVILPSSRLFFSPASQTAQLSHHWLPQEVALNSVGGSELAQLSQKANFRSSHPHPWLVFMSNISEAPPASLLSTP